MLNSKFAVVVLPSVPVMPTSAMLRLGCPYHAALSQANAARPFVTRTWVIGRSASTCSPTMTAAPARDRIRDEAMAVDPQAPIGDKTRASDDLARIGGNLSDVNLRIARHGGNIRQVDQ